MSRNRNAALALIIVLSLFGRGEAAVINARSVSQSDVGAAVASAKDGDTVIVPAGTASWTTTLTVSKAITLEGAGVGKTIILDDLSRNGNTLVISTSSDKFYRLSGFEFRPGKRTQRFTKGCVLVNGTSKTFRIDHCKFYGVLNRPIYTRNAVCGVIDHCAFVIDKRGGGSVHIFHDAWDGKSWGDGSWAVPINWGGPNAIYIEDNDFSSSTSDQFGILDEYAGARFVFRYNTATNGTIASHGTGSTGRNRGVRQWEIYNNTFTFDPPTARNAIHMRGGTGVVFNNTITGTSKFLTLHTYRYQTAFPKWPGSDGTCGWDLNDAKLYASGTAGAGSGIGPNSTGGTLVVPGAGWSANQWVGYTIRDLDGLSNIQPPASRGDGPGPFFSSIVSNTQDTIIAKAGSQQPNKIFAPGDRFEIRKVIQGLDMVGGSTGDLLSDEKARHQSADRPSQNQRNKRGETAGGRRLRAVGQLQTRGKDGTNALTPRWLNQTLEPVYVWNNTANGVANAGVAIAPDSPIKEGLHFFNNKPKPNYKPLVHPHPLVTQGASMPPRN